MLVRVKLEGTGEPKDPYRVNLPTYTHHFHVVSEGRAYVNVPDDVHPFDEAEFDPGDFEETSSGPALVRLSEENHSQWHQHLDNKYRERSGEFRPVVQ